MTQTYRTKQGDTWDSIAYSQMGGTAYTGQLMQVNGQYLQYYTFPAGIILTLPQVQQRLETVPVPWKEVSG